MNIKEIATSFALAAVAVTGLTMAANAGPGHHETAELGLKAPDFTLNDFNGDSHTLSEYIEDGKTVVLEWFNPACPYVVRHYDKLSTMNDLAAEYGTEGVVWMSVNSSSADHPGHTMTAKMAKEWGINHPILNDADGKVGKMYGAKTTPHMFIINKEGVLVYNGAIDNDRRGNLSGNDKVNYVENALGELARGKTVSVGSTKAYGCSVKYAK